MEVSRRLKFAGRENGGKESGIYRLSCMDNIRKRMLWNSLAHEEWQHAEKDER